MSCGCRAHARLALQLLPIGVPGHGSWNRVRPRATFRCISGGHCTERAPNHLCATSRQERSTRTVYRAPHAAPHNHRARQRSVRGRDDQSVSVARDRLCINAIIGASAAIEQEVDAAIADGAEYISVGYVFPTSSKPDAGEPLGKHRLGQMVGNTSSRIPLVAIGSINVDKVVLCKRAWPSFRKF
ncbi:thiamine-phosphate pyrophosphorylase [Gracilaria domingensis]|nr:thiamine-phosphate pyrophosphorylase [Gracilaria domingensis]